MEYHDLTDKQALTLAACIELQNDENEVKIKSIEKKTSNSTAFFHKIVSGLVSKEIMEQVGYSKVGRSKIYKVTEYGLKVYENYTTKDPEKYFTDDTAEALKLIYAGEHTVLYNILDAINSSKPSTRLTIATMLGKKPQQVTTQIKRLVDSGFVKQTKPEGVSVLLLNPNTELLNEYGIYLD